MTEKVTKKKTKTVETNQITVTQYGSAIRRNGIQREQLKTLGLGKMNAVKTLTDSPSVRALVKRLGHMVRVIEKE